MNKQDIDNFSQQDKSSSEIDLIIKKDYKRYELFLNDRDELIRYVCTQGFGLEDIESINKLKTNIQEYINSCRKEIGMDTIPAGNEIYDYIAFFDEFKPLDFFFHHIQQETFISCGKGLAFISTKEGTVMGYNSPKEGWGLYKSSDDDYDYVLYISHYKRKENEKKLRNNMLEDIKKLIGEKRFFSISDDYY